MSSPGPSELPMGLRLSEAEMPPDAPDDPHVALVRRYLTALDGGDPAQARSLLTQDITWTIAGRSRVAGTHRGPDAVVAVDTTMRQLSSGTLRHEVMVWLAAGEHAHAVAAVSAERDGVAGRFNRAFVFTVGDLITGIHVYDEDLYAFDAFWA